MNHELQGFTKLNDSQLLTEVSVLAARERHATARLIAALAELDARRLYLGEGYSSLFTYCTQALHLSEHAAYARIEAARAARRWPTVLERLEDGSVTLTNLCLLARHMTADNHLSLLDTSRYKSKREVENQIAALNPLPPVATLIRKLPPPRPHMTALLEAIPVQARVEAEPCRIITAVSPAAAIPVQRTTLKPLSPERYKLQLTIDRDTHDKLRQVQDLMRHANRDADPATIFERALTLLLADLQKKKCGLSARPRQSAQKSPTSRYIPAAVRREVWKRDDARCAFVGNAGRCSETSLLEFHHVVPFADGGPTTADNLQLRCRAHNAHEAREHFADVEPTVHSLFG